MRGSSRFSGPAIPGPRAFMKIMELGRGKEQRQRFLKETYIPMRKEFLSEKTGGTSSSPAK